MKVICPTAPTMPVTLNAGFQMPSWFDLKTLDISGPEDAEGIRKASQNLHTLINSEISAGIESERIIVGGFSQGGALALYSALTFPKPLGGVISLSCWLPLHKQFPGLKISPDSIPVSILDILKVRRFFQLRDVDFWGVYCRFSKPMETLIQLCHTSLDNCRLVF